MIKVNPLLVSHAATARRLGADFRIGWCFDDSRDGEPGKRALCCSVSGRKGVIAAYHWCIQNYIAPFGVPGDETLDFSLVYDTTQYDRHRRHAERQFLQRLISEID